MWIKKLFNCINSNPAIDFVQYMYKKGRTLWNSLNKHSVFAQGKKVITT